MTLITFKGIWILIICIILVQIVVAEEEENDMHKWHTWIENSEFIHYLFFNSDTYFSSSINESSF